MNERIKELKQQAEAHVDSVDDGLGIEHYRELVDLKFAELIVRECVNEMSQQMYWHRIDQSNNPNFYKAVEKTLKHFGVEE